METKGQRHVDPQRTHCLHSFSDVYYKHLWLIFCLYLYSNIAYLLALMSIKLSSFWRTWVSLVGTFTGQKLVNFRFRTLRQMDNEFHRLLVESWPEYLSILRQIIGFIKRQLCLDLGWFVKVCWSTLWNWIWFFSKMFELFDRIGGRISYSNLGFRFCFRKSWVCSNEE